MTAIKPIQTRYKGCNFRSRLEARYAVYFDALNIKWEYETEGYDINGKWYLPDFWLPELEIFVEIKPDSDKGSGLYNEFSNKINSAIVLMRGSPWNYRAIFYGWDSCDSGGGEYKDECIFGIDGDWVGLQVRVGREDRNVFVSEWDTNKNVVALYHPDDEQWEYFKEDTFDVLTKDAAYKARSARFEHGESGAT
jgi:hypothetical protein